MRGPSASRLFVLAALCCLASAGASPAQETDGPGEEQEAAGKIYFDLDIPLIGGGELRAEDLRGKILVVDVWGTWCGPCRRVIPHLIEIQKSFGPRGVEVIGISAEPGDDLDDATRKVLRFAAELGINYSLGIFDPGLYQWIRSLMMFEGDSFTVPSTFVVDDEGAVVGRFPGYFPGQERELRQLIEEMLEARAARLPGGAGAP